jgi:cyclic pyranopterin phosphate synthase
VPKRLTHLDERGRARMVDVGDKPETERIAVASAAVKMSRATLAQVTSGRGKKGDALAVARLAALAGIKRTPDLIPLCHPIRVVGTDVDAVADARLPGVRIVVRVRAIDRTGAEMEAMAGAATGALALYDMVKGVERGVTIREVRLEEKRGGRSGVWRRGGR